MLLVLKKCAALVSFSSKFTRWDASSSMHGCWGLQGPCPNILPSTSHVVTSGNIVVGVCEWGRLGRGLAGCFCAGAEAAEDDWPPDTVPFNLDGQLQTKRPTILLQCHAQEKSWE